MSLAPHALAILLAALPLAGAAAQEPAPDAPLDPNLVATPAPDAPLNPNPVAALDLEGLSATRLLPLFTPTRSPPVVEEPPEPEVLAPPEPEPEPEPPPLELVGIVLTETEEVALFRDPANDEVHRLNPGDDYDGWSLRIVDTRSVEFESDGRTHTLKMFEEFPADPYDDYYNEDDSMDDEDWDEEDWEEETSSEDESGATGGNVLEE
ncbi:MAG TPA: hypothetical protein VGA77_10495 [Propylenella sp.]